MKTEEEQKRSIIINDKIKIYQGQIKLFREMINDLKREKNFINGHYDKTWEEEYC